MRQPASCILAEQEATRKGDKKKETVKLIILAYQKTMMNITGILLKIGKLYCLSWEEQKRSIKWMSKIVVVYRLHQL